MLYQLFIDFKVSSFFILNSCLFVTILKKTRFSQWYTTIVTTDIILYGTDILHYTKARHCYIVLNICKFLQNIMTHI